MDIQPPDYELRMAILRDKISQSGMEIPEEVMDFLAKNLQENIRQLEAARGRAETVLDFYENIEQISAKEAKVLSIATQTLDDLTKIKGLEGAAAGVSPMGTISPAFVSDILVMSGAVSS